MLTLTGADAYGGDTTVSAGTLQVVSASAIGSVGNLEVDAIATLDLDGSNVTINGLTVAGTVTNDGSAPATFTVGANDETSQFDGVIEDGSGSVALVKTGAGTLTLSGANGNNTYSGGTTVDEGVLEALTPGALPNYADAADLALSAGATVAVPPSAPGFPSDWSYGDIENLLDAIVSGSGNLGLDVPSGATFGYDTPITGSVGLTKLGDGKLLLNGATPNTFTGGTDVKAGVLTLGASSPTPLEALYGQATINGGTVNLNGQDVTLGWLAGDGGTITDNSTGAGVTTLTVNVPSRSSPTYYGHRQQPQPPNRTGGGRPGDSRPGRRQRVQRADPDP